MNTDKKDDLALHPPTDVRSNSLVPVAPAPQAPPPRKSRRLAIGVLVLAGLAMAAALWGLYGEGGTPRAPVETLAAGPVERVLAVSGRTETDDHSDIRSTVSARVTEVRASEGDAVEMGDELVILDASQQSSRVRQALAALDAAILKEQQARPTGIVPPASQGQYRPSPSRTQSAIWRWPPQKSAGCRPPSSKRN